MCANGCEILLVDANREAAREVPPNGGIARENGFGALAIGGMAEHAHVLLSLKPAMPVATAIKIVKQDRAVG